MMFGHIETLAERIEHLDRLRQLQDETGGFTAFICWTFQPEHTDMAHIAAGGLVRIFENASRHPAVPRQHPEHSIELGDAGGEDRQIALLFGANDMGSLMIEENVVAVGRHGVSRLRWTQIRRCVHSRVTFPAGNVFYEYIDKTMHPSPHELKEIPNGRFAWLAVTCR